MSLFLENVNKISWKFDLLFPLIALILTLAKKRKILPKLFLTKCRLLFPRCYTKIESQVSRRGMLTPPPPPPRPVCFGYLPARRGFTFSTTPHMWAFRWTLPGRPAGFAGLQRDNISQDLRVYFLGGCVDVVSFYTIPTSTKNQTWMVLLLSERQFFLR